jgi:alpha-N-arabinofuranosidase
MFNMLMRASPDVPVSDMTGIMELAGIWKKRGVVYRTPSAYVLGMFAGAPIEHLLPVKVESGSYTIHNGSSRIPDIDHVPFLDVDAAISKDGRTVTLFVINRDLDRDSTARLMIPGIQIGAKAEVETLSSQDLYAKNDEITPEAIIPDHTSIVVKPDLHYTFPKASFTKLTLSVN